MKKHLNLILGLALAATLFACKKDQVIPDDDPSTVSIKDKLKATLPGGSMASAVPVVYQNGQYYSAWGGGINFGSTFTHPTTLTSAEHGLTWMPLTNPPYGENNLLYSYSKGQYFVLVYGTAVNGLSTAMASTATDWTVWIGDTYITSGAPPSLIPKIVSYGGSATGIIEVVGQFVTDINSPTYVSIVGASYVAQPWPSPQALPGVINGYLGTVTYNNIIYELQGTNGVITHVRDITNGNFIDIDNYSGYYLVGRNGAFINVELTLDVNGTSPTHIGPINVTR